MHLEEWRWQERWKRLIDSTWEPSKEPLLLGSAHILYLYSVDEEATADQHWRRRTKVTMCSGNCPCARTTTSGTWLIRCKMQIRKYISGYKAHSWWDDWCIDAIEMQDQGWQPHLPSLQRLFRLLRQVDSGDAMFDDCSMANDDASVNQLLESVKAGSMKDQKFLVMQGWEVRGSTGQCPDWHEHKISLGI